MQSTFRSDSSFKSDSSGVVDANYSIIFEQRLTEAIRPIYLSLLQEYKQKIEQDILSTSNEIKSLLK